VPADTTGTLACNEFRMLMRHRAVRKDRHEGEQRSTNARVNHRAVRKDIHAGMCPGRCGQKRCVQSAVPRCASLHVSLSTRWQRRGQKSHTRNHCHLCHAGTSGICEASGIKGLGIKDFSVKGFRGKAFFGMQRITDAAA